MPKLFKGGPLMNKPICQTVWSIVIFALGAALAPSARLAGQDKSQDIVLAEGTPITVVTAQEITSKDVKPNDPVNFTVNEDLVVNGTVVVRKGVAAIGSVINAEKGGHKGKARQTGLQGYLTPNVRTRPFKC